MPDDRFHLGAPEAVAVRFTILPGLELVRAVRRIHHPALAPLHRSMLRQVGQRVPPGSIETLGGAIGARGYTPDFLVQPNAATPADLLRGIRTAPPELVATELRRARDEGNRAIPAAWVKDPVAARDLLADAAEVFWQEGLAPEWPLIRSVLEADIARRSSELADMGLAAVIGQLQTDLRWSDTMLVRSNSRWGLDVDCRGRGLRLAPTVMGWPGGAITTDEPWTPTIHYPAHHATALPARDGSPAPALIGRTRAAILDHLRIPARTTDVAQALGISAATASHHLHILEDAGLVATARRGKEAWHSRSSIADRLGW